MARIKMACEVDTYISASYSKEDDQFDFDAVCNGGAQGDCGFRVDLTADDAPDVDSLGFRELESQHRAHSIMKGKNRS